MMYFWPIGDILFRKLLYPIGFQQILLISEKNVCEKHFWCFIMQFTMHYINMDHRGFNVRHRLPVITTLSK